MSVEIGKKVADCTLPATGGKDISLSDYAGKTLVVYFYPKDNTPGCTQEGQDFRDLYKKFKAAGAEILGVSRDSVKVHENFKAKHEFPFELLSDKDEVLCKQFDVIRKKKLYGREYMGVDRSTFVIDSKGKLVREWRSVKVKGHAQEVLETVKTL
ncbi:MAG: peroxiredoxin [Salinisphaeraceae bacterium]|nr:peroxiredoxin [Salinisphaeraceae bacterium]